MKWKDLYRTIFNSNWWKRHWYGQVTSRLNPRNKWARKIAPRRFTDVDYIFEETLFEGLKFFWIEDDGRDSMYFQLSRPLEEDEPESNRNDSYQAYMALKEAYNWALVRKEKMENTKTWQEDEELVAIDTRHLHNIIRYRKWMWT